MQENISPEEKLLNLIKKGNSNPKDTVPEPSPSAQGKNKKKEESVQEPEKTQKGIGPVPKKIRKKVIAYFSLLNKFLIICILGAIIYLVFGYLFPYKSEIVIPGVVSVGERVIDEAPEPQGPLSHYTGVLSQRQMFKLYEAPKPKPTGPPKPKVTLQQLLGGYTFVGIIFGDVPQAIVEERRTGQSFYLTSGQYLGEIKIEKIEKGKITVSYEDERMDVSI